MPKPLRNYHPLLSALNNSLTNLPAPPNLSIWWNFGSLLGLCLVIQIATGLFLAIHYTPHTDMAFSSIAHLTRDVNYGWLIRNIHATGSSCFFICLYLHLGRNIYYGSYFLQETWNVGILLFLLLILTAFLGYVLPWGQISFWGATVITNLLSAIPYVGNTLVEWLWGGFAVDNATLTRFFALHFITPFIIVIFTAIHFLFLHQTGSSNPATPNTPLPSPFHSYYTINDLLGACLFLVLLASLSLFFPYLLTDPENFIPANPLATPIHIIPEWYFLWAYAILRAIPNNLGGVTTIFAAIFILFFLPLLNSGNQINGYQFHPPSQLLFWSLSSIIILLTWIGARPVAPPFDWLAQIFTASYFFLLLALPLSSYLWERLQ